MIGAGTDCRIRDSGDGGCGLGADGGSRTRVAIVSAGRQDGGTHGGTEGFDPRNPREDHAAALERSRLRGGRQWRPGGPTDRPYRFVPISHIMSTRRQRADQPKSPGHRSGCPVSVYLAAFAKYLAEFGVSPVSH